MIGRNADPQEYMKALSGLDFPASKSAIFKKAQDKGGFDTEILHILENLPERTYDDAADLTAEVARTYERVGPLADGGPAAPSEQNSREKGLIETLADPRAGESR
jgi:hypothetical protein